MKKTTDKGNNQDDVKATVPVAEYNEFLSGLILTGIGLDSVLTQVRNRQGIQSAETLIPQIAAKAQYESHEHHGKHYAAVFHEFTVVIPVNDEPAFFLQFTFQFDYETKKPFTPELFEIFKQMVLPIQASPFIREFIHNMMSRMAVPPMVLPLIKSPHLGDGPGPS
ncbi:MAG: hypothetical protein JSS72_01850 [Armatimonadetes bacterium]|nr:hypothetical protein [Armatimonadota bacterium]